ncbi:arf-GAP with Rho-GAP domain, ANK repeat and PH domain-containing protein 2 [Thunnus maccoyii]|uniref:arf-GAP with Rho-GAP domain, ANK repeat and PH domain-containing protein 2 n=1 Tax=Thunnus maccoyii TaxID=8240 RepID=UPI001C4B164D|nr:arf-GAP with Rho-GAP domain, ANK repeat and PH domain-containing protein 2 [Thunnus maccoyii]XP_042256742.1 arf-GAP with Rho-GAP domain, ANK repeat and PH domain-containing protein 2 [Thunnus maccoyii]XP_042256743.1 arf-GAP with Rho-GAP domain, ANK repeat and PH domain-containing protein 2 [Thunnus maccoyii]XP_042256744.1 arf-GAP with Rho-GAP domain, ANK repeat and PH domain-containing protein 2 [Thunnus maccoyii]XP_042256745.1 arf-GAP with Rho-GAP domain, ANK repeat and PH domain-containing
MLEPPEPSQEIKDWLCTLRLSQYTPYFQQRGYHVLEDCKDLTDERLLELRVFPTGHRRRILRSLEALRVTQQSGGEEDEEGGLENGRGQRKPVLHPRHIFLPDKKRGTSCQHPQSNEKSEYDLEGSQSLPPGAGLGSEFEDIPKRNVRPPLPAPRNPQNIQKSTSQHTSVPASMLSSSSSSSSESISISEIPSDWEVSSEEPSLSSTDSVLHPTLSEDQGGFQCEMVENSIYEMHTSFKVAKGPRLTRSYRLRHRPVPEIPNQTMPPLQDRSATPAQTTSPEHLTGFEGPTGANGIQKAPLQRTLTPIAPYGETFLYNRPESVPDQGGKEVLQKGFKDKIKQKKQRRKILKKRDSKEKESPPAPTIPDSYKDEYSTVVECASILPQASFDQGFAVTPNALAVGAAASGSVSQGGSLIMVECDLYSEPADALRGASINALPDISPYACFYGAPKHKVLKVGWLDKLSPQGKCVFQRRWVRFDGKSLAYYNNDKEMYSKGMILASGIRQVRGLGDNKFEVVTTLRTFIFRADREGERQEWMETLQTAMRPPACSFQKRSSLPHQSSTNKRGLLELRGYKGRVLVSLAGSKVRLCKTEQDYKAGLAIAEVELTAANIRDVDRRGFEINTPFKNFCFTAESEGEKEEWIEAVQESIAETLSDYEVAEKIWFNEANRSCADCRAPQPEWVSVNLGVVICKKCAGQHRSLGPSISKVRSLKLDSSIWSNELVELFLEVGNRNANSFWASNLPLEEELYSGASAEQRATFVRRKYRERKYRKVLEGFYDLEQLNQALCAAVVLPGVLQTMELVFSGADVMCATGDPTCSTPYLLAQRAGQRLQMEFLHQNKLSDFPILEQWSENASLSDASLFMDGFLYISSGPAKTALDRRGRDEILRRWCTLEGGFLSYYESERNPSAIGRVDITEVVSLAVSNTETMTGAGAVFTVELYLQTERVLIVGAETQETQHDWIQALTKCFIPSKVEGLVQRDSELIGKLHYKEGHDLYHWRLGWFALEGSALHFSSGEEAGEEEVLQLKQLHELTVSTHTEGEDKIQVLLMVEGGRTVYIHGFNKMDFTLWHSAITQAAGTDGNALSDQQLTKNGVPIIVDSCIAFVTQYGLCQEGVYQKPGDPGRVALLLEEFTRNARNVKLREKEHHLEDVAGTLKDFLSQAEDALLTKELYPYWVSALDEKDEKQRVKKYSTFIESLPKINRSTLEALLQHLYRIQQCSHLNQMPSEKLASVFSSCLFQTGGQTPQEINVVHDLINNYITLFSVNEDQVQQMERENSFITRWNDKKDTTFSPAGDLIFEVYLEKRKPENCCLIKVSPSMRSTELAESALSMRNITFNTDDLWTTFEVIENGELERPLHHSEKILEQVLEWSTLECPSSAFLVMKKFAGAERVADGKDQRQFIKGDYLKFNDGSSKLLSGHKFQDKYVVLRAEQLLLYRDIKSAKAEKVIQLKSVKCFLGLKKKIKPPTSWGFTVNADKQQWHFCCENREAQVSWVTDIIRMKYGSDLCAKSVNPKEAVVHKSSRGGAVSEGGAILPQNHNYSQQPTDRRTSLDDGNPRTVKDASLHQKTNTAANCPRHNEMLKAPEVPRRRTSVDAGQPQCLPSPSLSRHLQPKALPLPPQSVCKTTGRRPILGGEGLMPPSLMNELNSVLNKTGRTAKNND